MNEPLPDDLIIETARWLRAQADKLKGNSNAIAGKGWFPSAKHVRIMVAQLENIAWATQQAPNRPFPITASGVALILATFHRTLLEQAGLPRDEFDSAAQRRRSTSPDRKQREETKYWCKVDALDAAHPGLTPQQLLGNWAIKELGPLKGVSEKSWIEQLGRRRRGRNP